MHIDRRTFVAALAAGTGCAAPVLHQPDLVVVNRSGRAVTARVLVVRVESGDPALERTVSLTAGERREFDVGVETGRRVRIVVAVEGGPSGSHEMPAPGARTGVVVRITRDDVRFEERLD